MIVALAPYEKEWAYTVGIRRHNANLHKHDAQHYKPELMEDNLRASIAAACCEIAVAKATGRYWSGSAWDSAQHAWFNSEPDVYPCLEVRRTRIPGGSLPIRERDKNSNRIMVQAYVTDAFNINDVDVTGWCHAPWGWDNGTPSHYDPDKTRLVRQDLLQPIDSLRADHWMK